ncbi:hypothetical protein AB833_17175 [Chromatiales bacterium (ex Bugula neritina AB1)]|nr:hypothetical protein AB833_17175 [Chromatiales bacterium (ex Bugula neritina AB1)]
MAVKVKFFASMREYLNRSELDITVTGETTVAAIWVQAAGDKPMPADTVCAVNQTQAKPEFTVVDGDEVAFFPPVTGG